MSRQKQHTDPFSQLEAARRYLGEGRFLMAMECLDSIDEWLRTNAGNLYAENIRRQVVEIDRRANEMKGSVLASIGSRGRVQAGAK